MIEANGEARQDKEINREFRQKWHLWGGVYAFLSREEEAVNLVESWICGLRMGRE